MEHRAWLLSVMSAAWLATGCHSGARAEPATPAAAPSVAAPPTATPVALPAPSTAPAPVLAPASGYAMCHGQRLASASAAPRSGAVTVQLAPAFTDEMAACKTEDRPPSQVLSAAKVGVINAKGDCEFGSVGVSCHYHSGSEFLASSTVKQTPGQGELHCIFPSDDAKSPRVYGGHVTCKNHAQGELHGAHAGHEVKQGAACSSELLGQLETCKSYRCCDDGTLTNPVADLVHDGRNDVRPDFRICEDTLEINCDLLANFTAHDANAPALGGVREAVFHVAPTKPGKAPAAPAKHAAAPSH